MGWVLPDPSVKRPSQARLRSGRHHARHGRDHARYGCNHVRRGSDHLGHGRHHAGHGCHDVLAFGELEEDPALLNQDAGLEDDGLSRLSLTPIENSP